ncbi:MAG: Aspartyl/Asparaginyl beta-hydroxylase [Bacteroidota bacterium]|jgi:hypothetical protein
MDTIQQATEILRKPIGWIELDIDFPIDKWIDESKLAEQYLVPHREGDGHLGWRSCCIHGIDIDKTGHWSRYSKTEDIEYKWTELANLVPTITNFWKKFPTEKFARLRFMELAPYGFIAPHDDSPNGIKNTDFDMMDHMIPINLAITHPDDCYMELEGYGRVPFRAGRAFIVNITNVHSVINHSNQSRLHMIAHCIIGNKKKEFAELIVRSYNKHHA